MMFFEVLVIILMIHFLLMIDVLFKTAPEYEDEIKEICKKRMSLKSRKKKGETSKTELLTISA